MLDSEKYLLDGEKDLFVSEKYLLDSEKYLLDGEKYLFVSEKYLLDYWKVGRVQRSLLYP